MPHADFFMVTDVIENKTEQKFKNIKRNETFNANSCQLITTTTTTLVNMLRLIPTFLHNSIHYSANVTHD